MTNPSSASSARADSRAGSRSTSQRGTHSGVRLDPRAKLYLLLLANLLLFFHVDTRGEAIMVALFLLPLFVAGRWRNGLRLAVLYFALLGLGLWSDAATMSGSGGSGGSLIGMIGGGVTDTAAGSSGTTVAAEDVAATAASATDAFVTAGHVAGLLSVGIRMMMPCLITGAYAFTTTSISEFVCAMRRMRVPEAIVIPCMVVIRFFPTIVHDYRQIRNAMALRGIAAGRFALVRHPVQSLEFIIVPLLMNATFVSRDLSVAALTKGLGIAGEHTCMTVIRMCWFDWAYMAVCTAPLALAIGGVL
ncbi:energy-coupling factor transporter transmembrane protein EcfT [Bifidobacterium sp. 82T10]|uniref:Energy-coupling factor transporter transmembrane protein EcfT n=1 Tax=Bifidobacterium miconis TaxID=2834435 RepID=A0ABS6WGQ6_9BIFI|nr:energy-coupling factor transporter transmembrane component T [Bifidobacterium miconis]MBW3093122.1 energy-coupling factor transporter transmembrane protein EcfT [Bifidobacterium miconis]